MKLSTFGAFKCLHVKDARELSASDVASLQAVLLSMFRDLVEVCEAVRTDWMLAGGSALGAIRHGGFIPWDDDLDILMPRADWPRFREAFRAKHGDRYAVYEPGSPPSYGLAFPRIRLRGTRVVTREDLLTPDVEPGAFIDVFLFENTFDWTPLRGLHGIGSLALGFFYSCRKQFFERRLLRAWGLNGVAFRVKRLVGFFLAFLPLGVWTRLWDGWNRLCRNGASRFVTCPVGRRHFFGELAPRAEMVGSRELPFAGRRVRVPAGLEAYLTRLYGPDYLTPPPPERRERHAVFAPLWLDALDTRAAVMYHNKP